MLRHKAQSSVEYALLIAVAVAAIVAVQFYMQRGVQGRLKESTDQIGKQFEASVAENDYVSYWRRNETGETNTEEYRPDASGTSNTTVTSSGTIDTDEYEEWGGPGAAPTVDRPDWFGR